METYFKPSYFTIFLLACQTLANVVPQRRLRVFNFDVISPGSRAADLLQIATVGVIAVAGLGVLVETFSYAHTYKRRFRDREKLLIEYTVVAGSRVRGKRRGFREAWILMWRDVERTEVLTRTMILCVAVTLSEAAGLARRTAALAVTALSTLPILIIVRELLGDRWPELSPLAASLVEVTLSAPGTAYSRMMKSLFLRIQPVRTKVVDLAEARLILNDYHKPNRNVSTGGVFVRTNEKEITLIDPDLVEKCGGVDDQEWSKRMPFRRTSRIHLGASAWALIIYRTWESFRLDGFDDISGIGDAALMVAFLGLTSEIVSRVMYVYKSETAYGFPDGPLEPGTAEGFRCVRLELQDGDQKAVGTEVDGRGQVAV